MHGIAFFFFRFLQPKASNPSVPYTAERTQAEIDATFAEFENRAKSQTTNHTISNSTTDLAAQASPKTNEVSSEPEPIASFSTPLKSRANGRRNNIEITASVLEGTVIEAGQTFSFNEVVGKPTSARGYQKADVLVDGKTIQAIGGGKIGRASCRERVSSPV